MGTIIYLAGTSWDAVAGTDKNLATALAQENHVLWVDPPVSVLGVLRSRVASTQAPQLEQVGERIVRLRTVGPPGVTRPGLRRCTEVSYHQAVRAAVKKLRLQAPDTICASPILTFPQGVGGTRLYFVTDDWDAGAALMGFSAQHLARVRKINAAKATVVAAVSEHLAGILTERLGRDVTVVPNGCRLKSSAYATNPGFARAALVGQLNERLNFDVLDAVADTGIHVAVAGPKTAKSPRAVSRLNAFLSRPNVHWHGVLSSAAVDELLASSNVGLTPYADTPFNRASFPLKTLEYLAAGLSVVATHLPPAQFGAATVRLAREADDFARAVTELAADWPTDAERARQAEQIKGHSWEHRAEQVEQLLLQ